jgi:hypothetical protein
MEDNAKFLMVLEHDNPQFDELSTGAYSPHMKEEE